MQWEIDFLKWVDNTLHGSDFINQIVKYFSVLNDIGLLCIFVGIILVASKKYRKFGILMLVSLLFGWILNDLILKNVIGRPRPFEKDQQLSDFVYSMFVKNEKLGFLNNLIGGKVPSLGKAMPSGHSYISFNAAVFLFMVDRKKFGIPALIIASLMALSRLFLCVHYPTDVLVGSLLGATNGFLMYHFFHKYCLPKEGDQKCA